MMKKKQIKVIYTKSGLANNFGTHIELNEKLKHNKFLRDFIIKHELGHKTGFDLDYEIKDALSLILKPKVAFSLLYLYITTPSAYIDLLPIQIRKKQIVYDLNLTILYFFIGLLIFLLIKIFF